MEYKSLFTCLLLTSVNFGVNVVIFTLSQSCFKLDFKLSPCTECCMLFLVDSPAYEIFKPTFRNTLSVR